MVFHTGRWYVVGHDHLRDSLRTFRIDRITSVTPRADNFTAPDGFAPVTHLTSILAQGPYRWHVELTIHGPLDDHDGVEGRSGGRRPPFSRPQALPARRASAAAWGEVGAAV
ncbi:WYL domain-containing protein [Streptomyces sp. NPDC005706]|uniref:helix-turn-helix transcriptional regulator n=1 Tax=Streptomyces sp. NPDC005706 TaxID=3157169 RepID=UPI0033D20D5B